MSGNVAKLILSVDLGRDWRGRGVGEGEVVVVELISLSYRHPGTCTKRALRRIGRLWRQSCRTADRRGENKVVQVHRVGGQLWRWLLRGLRQLGLLVGGASQLLGNSAGSSPGRRPCARGRRGGRFMAVERRNGSVSRASGSASSQGQGAQLRARSWKQSNGWRLSYPRLRCSSARRIFRAIMRQVKLDMRSAFGSCVFARE